MSGFKFGLGEIVTIGNDGSDKAQRGTIEGRAEYIGAENNYFVRYRDAHGNFTEGWFVEHTLVLLGVTDANHPRGIYDFDALVEYGKKNGANIVIGMPWSFSFCGLAVTHENDDLYIVGPWQFRRGDSLVVHADGHIDYQRAI